MNGMTLKQFAIHRAFRLAELYNIAKQHMDTCEGRAAFIVLSVQIHAALGNVPRSTSRTVRRIIR